MAQVGPPDKRGRDTDAAVLARGAHRRLTAEELELADGLEVLGNVGAVHRLRLHGDRRDDVMPVGHEVCVLVDEEPLAAHDHADDVVRVVEQVVVGVDDGEVGVDWRLGFRRHGEAPLFVLRCAESHLMGSRRKRVVLLDGVLSRSWRCDLGAHDVPQLEQPGD